MSIDTPIPTNTPTAQAEPGQRPNPNSVSVDVQHGVFRRVLGVQAFQILLVLVVIFLIFTALAPTAFPQWSNLRQVIQNMSILGVLGIGMTFVIVTSGIDLSVGSVLVFSGVVAAKAMIFVGGDGWGTALVGLVVAIASGLAWGTLNGLLISKAKVPPLIVTLGSLGAALGLAEVITGGVDITKIPSVLSDNIGYGNLVGTTLPLISVIAIVFLVVFGVVLHRTKFGLYTFAVGSNEEAARRVGVKVDRQLTSVYALSGGLAGFAGLLSLSQFGTTAIAGQSQTNLNVIAAVVIGGTSVLGGVGTIFGTAVGLCIPAFLQNGFVIVGVQPFWQQVAVGFVLVVAVYIDQRRRTAAGRGSSANKSFLGSLLFRQKQ